MDNYRLRMKIGDHEIEAEGDRETVQAQLASFKELIEHVTAFAPAKPDPSPLPPNPPDTNATDNNGNRPDPTIDSRLDKIMRFDGRIVSLTVRPSTVEDAVLLLLYGQRMLRGQDAVGGWEVISGLTATGGLAVNRVDRLLEKLGRDGDAIVTGERRAKRYRLTNTGLAKARKIASEQIAIVA